MQYLSFSQLRRKLGSRSKSAVYRDVRLGRLPSPLKIGGKLYWNETEVDEVIEVHRVDNAEKPKSGLEQDE